MSVVDPDSFEIVETLAANSGIAWVIVYLANSAQFENEAVVGTHLFFEV